MKIRCGGVLFSRALRLFIGNSDVMGSSLTFSTNYTIFGDDHPWLSSQLYASWYLMVS